MLKQGEVCSHCEKYTDSTRLCKCETGVRHGSVCSWTAWKPPTLFFIKMKNKNLASLLLFLSRWASGRADLNFRI